MAKQELTDEQWLSIKEANKINIEYVNNQREIAESQGNKGFGFIGAFTADFMYYLRRIENYYCHADINTDTKEIKTYLSWDHQ